jgi:hypothetical protein
MFMNDIQALFPRQQSMRKVPQRPAERLLQTIRAAMADTQSDADAVTMQKYSPQLRAVSIAVQM